MQIGNKAPCGQNNAYFTLKIACLIVMIMNKKNLKARISKKGKYHIAHIQMPQSMVKILKYFKSDNKNRGVGRSSQYLLYFNL